MASKVNELVQECRRQQESCNYTASGLYSWQKSARRWKVFFIVAPIIIGGLAGWQALGQFGEPAAKLIGPFLGLLAGFFPAIYSALDLGMQVADIGRAASEFTNLRDRFRQLANIKSLGAESDFETAFEALMDRMDAIRTNSPSIPEWAFKNAQKKIKRGHYDFDADASAAAAAESTSA